MTLERLLEAFDPLATRTQPGSVELQEVDIERLRTEAYEAGYASGWEDAAKAETEGRQRVRAEFERNIQNLAFTYNEAVDRIRAELREFLNALLNGFLPRLAPDLLREHVRAELMRIADRLIEVPIELVCSPDCSGVVRELLDGDFAMEIALVEDATLAERQVFVRIAEREIEFDLDPLLTALQRQFRALYSTPEEKDASNG